MRLVKAGDRSKRMYGTEWQCPTCGAIFVLDREDAFAISTNKRGEPKGVISRCPCCEMTQPMRRPKGEG